MADVFYQFHALPIAKPTGSLLRKSVVEEEYALGPGPLCRSSFPFTGL